MDRIVTKLGFQNPTFNLDGETGFCGKRWRGPIIWGAVGGDYKISEAKE